MEGGGQGWRLRWMGNEMDNVQLLHMITLAYKPIKI